MQRVQRRGFTLVEVLVVIAIIGALVALLLPAVQSAREAARRTQCRNHLKQMSLAMMVHESSHKVFPTGGWGFNWIGDPDRGTGLKQPGGWFYCILPQLELATLADIGKGLEGGAPDKNSPKGQALLKLISTPVTVYHCPSRRPAKLYPNSNAPYNCKLPPLVAKIDYAGNGGDNNIIDSTQAFQPRYFKDGDDPNYWNKFPPSNGVCIAHSQVAISQVRDGTSRCYLLGEKYLSSEYYEANGVDLGDNHSAFTGLNWDNVRTTSKAAKPPPYDLQPPKQDSPEDHNIWNFGSAHPTSFGMAFCDGSVHDIAYAIDPQVHRRLSHKSDGAQVPDSAY